MTTPSIGHDMPCRLVSNSWMYARVSSALEQVLLAGTTVQHATLGALRRCFDFLRILWAFFRDRLDHLRDDLARFFHDDRVAEAQVFATDLPEIVQRRVLHRCAR